MNKSTIEINLILSAPQRDKPQANKIKFSGLLCALALLKVEGTKLIYKKSRHNFPS